MSTTLAKRLLRHYRPTIRPSFMVQYGSDTDDDDADETRRDTLKRIGCDIEDIAKDDDCDSGFSDMFGECYDDNDLRQMIKINGHCMSRKAWKRWLCYNKVYERDVKRDPGNGSFNDVQLKQILGSSDIEKWLKSSEAKQIIVDMLDNPAANTRKKALSVLKDMKPLANHATAILKRLNDDDLEVKEMALEMVMVLSVVEGLSKDLIFAHADRIVSFTNSTTVKHDAFILLNKLDDEQLMTLKRRNSKYIDHLMDTLTHQNRNGYPDGIGLRDTLLKLLTRVGEDNEGKQFLEAFPLSRFPRDENERTTRWLTWMSRILETLRNIDLDKLTYDTLFHMKHELESLLMKSDTHNPQHPPTDFIYILRNEKSMCQILIEEVQKEIQRAEKTVIPLRKRFVDAGRHLLSVYSTAKDSVFSGNMTWGNIFDWNGDEMKEIDFVVAGCKILRDDDHDPLFQVTRETDHWVEKYSTSDKKFTRRMLELKPIQRFSLAVRLLRVEEITVDDMTKIFVSHLKNRWNTKYSWTYHKSPIRNIEYSLTDGTVMQVNLPVNDDIAQNMEALKTTFLGGVKQREIRHCASVANVPKEFVRQLRRVKSSSN